MSPEQSAKIAALTRWSREDPTLNATRGQAGLRARFLREAADAAAANGEEPTEKELARRADCAYRLHMTRVRLARSPKETVG